MKTKDKVICGGVIMIIVLCTLFTIRGSYAESTHDFERPKVEPIVRNYEVLKNKEVITKPSNATIREVTAYNAGDPHQTDSSPCISANGENVCIALEEGYKRCAANFVPFGTILRIAHYGDCMVTDRMNSRFSNRVDIAMKVYEKERALKFGKQNLEVEIIK